MRTLGREVLAFVEARRATERQHQGHGALAGAQFGINHAQPAAALPAFVGPGDVVASAAHAPGSYPTTGAQRVEGVVELLPALGILRYIHLKRSCNCLRSARLKHGPLDHEGKRKEEAK